jgi:hypothetical protein
LFGEGPAATRWHTHVLLLMDLMLLLLPLRRRLLLNLMHS